VTEDERAFLHSFQSWRAFVTMRLGYVFVMSDDRTTERAFKPDGSLAMVMSYGETSPIPVSMRDHGEQ